jgi:chemotaxis protein MotB
MSEAHGKSQPSFHGGGHEEEEEGGAPEWLISFADMVMLLMGFFVILFALNVQPKGGEAGGGGDQAEGVATQPQELDPEMVEAIRRAFHSPLNPSDPRDADVLRAIRERGEGDASDKGISGNEKRVRAPRDIEYYGQAADVSFAFRSASLDQDAMDGIDEFARLHAGHRYVIEIRGHASPPEAFNRPAEAMSLGWNRARMVHDRLIEDGISADRLRLVSAGVYEPRRARVGLENRAQDDQRVELLVRREPAGRTD